MTKRFPLLILPVLLILFGAFLRLFMLGGPYLWIDEITVMMFGGPSRSAWEIITEIYRAKFAGFTGQHMPLQYLMAHLAQQIEPFRGDPSAHFTLRLPFAVLGIASLPFVYLAASRAFDRAAGLWSLFLVSISFHHIFMSRDATSYSPLLFFLALHLWTATRLLDASLAKRARILFSLLFLLSAFGALFSHMTAWLFLGAEGALLGGAALWSALRGKREGSVVPSLFRDCRMHACVLLLLSTVPLWPLVFPGMHQFTASTDAHAEAEQVTLSLLSYQLAFLGWGRTGGRLLGFALAILMGASLLARRQDRTPAHFFLAGMLVLPTILFALVLSRDFYPRYLTIIQYPLIGFAALGLSRLTGAASRFSSSRWTRPVAAALLAAILCLWHLDPLRVLFGSPDKLQGIKPLHEWTLNHVPVRGLYVFRNSFYMREIPQTYPVGERFTAVSEYNERSPAFSANTRSYFERFPLAVLFLLPDSEYETSGWPWIHSDFSRVHACGGVEFQQILWRYGFWSGGYRRPNSVDWRVHYNTEEDVVARARARGASHVLIPQFGGWGFVQAQNLQLFATPLSPATLRVYNLTEKPMPGTIILRGAAQAPGAISVRHDASGRTGTRGDVTYPANASLELSLGRQVFLPGPTDVEISPLGGGRPSLFIYAFHLAADAAEPSRETAPHAPIEGH